MGCPKTGFVCTDADYKHFDETIMYCATGRCRTLNAAYAWMIDRYYSRSETINGVVVYLS